MPKQVTKSDPASQTPPASIESHPTHEEIAGLAYALWRARGCAEGTPDEDWSNAENALKVMAEV